MSGGLNKVSGGFFPAWAHTILKKFLSFCEYTFTQNILKSFHVLPHVLSLPFNVSDVLPFPCIIFPMCFPCIPMYDCTLAPFDVFTCIILARQPSINSPVTLKIWSLILQL
jgi:hypothetical protein